ncbi:predicted protein [Nematostella vectensis]|uniref:Cyclin-dependent kinase inhibitor domain-containing protein n=1 Tax=Nematostella vectensis TaxID=45351 RepID=A7RYF3_NEMVE|nr:predicted protein [Nematostella vectensis]|eukprot:XP_001635574.1 predicted protein [Nematostella vectensis]
MSLYHSQEPRVAEAGSISSLSSFSSDVVSAEESTRIHDGSSYEEEPTSSISEQEQDTSDDISSVSSHSITTVPRLSPDELKLLSRVCHLLRKRNEPLPIGHIGNDPELQELICKIHVTTFDSAEPFKWKTFLGKCNDTLDLSQRTLKGTQEWCVSLKECHKKRCPSTTSRLTDNSLDAHTSKDSNITEHAPVKLSKNQLRKLDSSLRNRLLSYLQTNSGEHALRDIVNQKCILKGVQNWEVSVILESFVGVNFFEQLSENLKVIMERGNSRNGVQRNLFGTAPADHSKTQDDLKREMEQLSKEKAKKWNFDFENLKPLPPGRYKWERVGKRLQTRESPPLDKTTTETSCSRTSEIVPSRKRPYNLRTRDVSARGTCLRPIEPPSSPRSKRWVEPFQTYKPDPKTGDKLSLQKNLLDPS